MLKKIFRKEAAGKPAVAATRTSVLAPTLEMDCLPVELLRQIFKYLSAEDLALLARVCDLWRMVLEEDELWRAHIPEKVLTAYKPDTPAKKIFKEEYLKNPAASFKPYSPRGNEHMLTVPDLYTLLGSAPMGINNRQFNHRLRHYGFNRLPYMKDIFGDDRDEFCQVRRAGFLVRIPHRELVPGDVVELRAGEVVPADIRVTQVNGLLVDKSFLTGDPYPVLLTTYSISPEFEDASNILFCATAVLAGSCVGVVFATGAQTYLGRIATAVLQERAAVARARLGSIVTRRPSSPAPATKRAESPAARFPRSPSADENLSAAASPMRAARTASAGSGELEVRRKGSASTPEKDLGKEKEKDKEKDSRLKVKKDKDDGPEVRNKKVLSVLGKVTAVVIDASMLLLAPDREVVQLLHYDNVTWTTRVAERGEKLYSPQHKGCQALLEGLALNVLLSSPLVEESNGASSVIDLGRLDYEPHLSLVGFLKPLVAFHYLIPPAKRYAHLQLDPYDLSSHLILTRKKEEKSEKKKLELLSFGLAEKLLPYCSKQLVDGKEVPVEWRDKLKIAQDMRERCGRVYALLTNARLDEADAAVAPSVILERRRMTLLGLIATERAESPHAPVVISKLKEYDTKLIVTFSEPAVCIKNAALQSGVPIARDLLACPRDKALDLDNPLEIDPSLRSLLVPGFLQKDFLKPVLAYDRVFFHRGTPLHKEAIVATLREQGEVVAYVANGMTDAVALTQADVGVAPQGAPPLITQLSAVGISTREPQHLVALLDLGPAPPDLITLLFLISSQ